MKRSKGPLNRHSEEVRFISSRCFGLLMDDLELGIKASCLVLLEAKEGTIFSDGEYLWFNPDWLVRQRPPEFMEALCSLMSQITLKPEATFWRAKTEGLKAGSESDLVRFRQRMIDIEIMEGKRKPEWPHDPVDPVAYNTPPEGFTLTITELPGGWQLRQTRKIGFTTCAAFRRAGKS